MVLLFKKAPARGGKTISGENLNTVPSLDNDTSYIYTLLKKWSHLGFEICTISILSLVNLSSFVKVFTIQLGF